MPQEKEQAQPHQPVSLQELKGKDIFRATLLVFDLGLLQIPDCESNRKS